MDDYLQYSLLLNRDPSEVEKLFKLLSINVTEFFRDKEIFDMFTTRVLPQLIKQNFNQIKIWSAACATGEEPYSISMLLNEKVDTDRIPFVKIIATDVNGKAVEFAKKGQYSQSSINKIPQRYIRKYFNLLPNTNTWQASYIIKSLIKFQEKNLLQDPAPLILDVVFCRNLLIYMEREKHLNLMKKFHNSLKEYGYLVLGNSDHVVGDSRKLFKPISPGSKIYQKIP